MNVFPKTLLAEISGVCGLSCGKCLVKRAERVFMKRDIFMKILSEVRELEEPFDIFLPYWRGESTLHPEFYEMMKEYAKENSRLEISKTAALDTNGQYSDPALNRFFVESGQFSRITFSIDAVREKTYLTVRKGGIFGKIHENIKMIMDFRTASGAEYPKITVQFIVMEENFREAGEFTEKWTDFFVSRNFVPSIIYDYDRPSPDYGDAIFLRLLMCGEKKSDEAFELFRKTVRNITGIFPEKRKSLVCAGPFSHTAVSALGNVFPCCADPLPQLSLGNIYSVSLRKMLESEKLSNIRKLHLSGATDKIKICGNCPGQVFPLTDREKFIKLSELYG